VELSFMLTFNDITQLIVSNDFFKFPNWHFDQELDFMMAGSILVNDLASNSVLAAIINILDEGESKEFIRAEMCKF
jgi:hypothetical protein